MGRTEYVIKELFKDGFINEVGRNTCLEEEEESGRTKLDVHMNSSCNYHIKNPDNNGMSDIGFFREEKSRSMKKRVDHIIFEKKNLEAWNIHLIEMKTTVGQKKWDEVKGKFRASLLFAEAVAAMLDMKVARIMMYTTYEKVNLSNDKYSPAGYRGRVGTKQVKPEDEWEGKDFGLNFGERIQFPHKPVQVLRSKEDNTLYGTLGL